MATKRITKADLDKDNYYKEDGLKIKGSLEIAAGLGLVKFRKGISVKGHILAKAGTGIEAGEVENMRNTFWCEMCGMEHSREDFSECR